MSAKQSDFSDEDSLIRKMMKVEQVAAKKATKYYRKHILGIGCLMMIAFLTLVLYLRVTGHPV